MNIENQVCSIEQSKKLKEFGIIQKSEWDWVYGNIEQSNSDAVAPSWVSGDIAWDRFGEDCVNKTICCFSAGELGVMLGLEPDGNSPKELRTEYFSDLIDTLKSLEGMTEANLRATVLLKALESGAMTAEVVNQRLTPTQPQ